MSPRSKEQFEIIRTQSRDKILDAALELFAENGFHNTSVAQISKKAGISKGLLYNYFESKDDLLNVLIHDALEHIDRVIDERLLNEKDPRKQLELIIRSSFDVIDSNKSYWKLFMLMAVHDDIHIEILEKSKSKQIEYMMLLSDIFKDLGIPNIEKEILLFNAILDGVGFHYMFGEASYPIDQMKQFIIDKYCKLP